jgi:hypothetical protein
MALLELATKVQLNLLAEDPTPPAEAPALLPNPSPEALPGGVFSASSHLIGIGLTVLGVLGILCFLGGCALVMFGGFGGHGSNGVGTLGKVAGGLVLGLSSASLVGGLFAL